jgi:hypothetical protein
VYSYAKKEKEQHTKMQCRKENPSANKILDLFL